MSSAETYHVVSKSTTFALGRRVHTSAEVGMCGSKGSFKIARIRLHLMVLVVAVAVWEKYPDEYLYMVHPTRQE